MAAHRKSDQRRAYPWAVALRKHAFIRQRPQESPEPSSHTDESKSNPGANVGRKVRGIGPKKTLSEAEKLPDRGDF